MVYFDYVYFRTAKFFFKKDGADATRALAFLSMTQSILLFELFFTINRYLLKLPIKGSDTKLAAIIFTFFLCYLNHLRYKNKYFLFRQKWFNEENLLYTIKGYLVLLALMAPFIILLLMADNPFFKKVADNPFFKKVW